MKRRSRADERILECELEIFEKLRTAVAAEAAADQARRGRRGARSSWLRSPSAPRPTTTSSRHVHEGERTDGPRRAAIPWSSSGCRAGDGFVPNDIALTARRQLVILTGPTWGGNRRTFGRRAHSAHGAGRLVRRRAREAKICSSIASTPCRRVGQHRAGHSTFWWRCRRRRTSSTPPRRAACGPRRDRPGTATFERLEHRVASPSIATNAKVRPKTLFRRT